MFEFSAIPHPLETEENRKKVNEDIKTAIGTKNYETLLQIAHQRIHNNNFIQALKNRDELNSILEEIDKEIDIAKGKNKNKDGVKKLCYVDVRTHSRRYREIAEFLCVLDKRIDEYKELTAHIIKHSSTLRETLGAHSLINYNAEQIGEFIASVAPHRNTPEEEQYKLGGIGGSDIAKILKTDPVNGSTHYRTLLKRKCGIEEENEQAPSFAINRGNLWEKSILMNYADQNPHKKIAQCSVSWIGQGKNSFYRARFDGLELDEENRPFSIIEIKTGIRSEEWGEARDHTGVPSKYRQQAIWYAKNAGLDKALIIAVLDDYDVREYEINMNHPEIIDEWNIINEAVQDFWQTVLKNREMIANGENPFPKRDRGFPKRLNKKDMSFKISAYSGINSETITEMIDSELLQLNKPASKLSQEEIQEILTRIYAQHNPQTRRKALIGIDIETNSFSPKTGRIIETGIVVSHSNGQPSIDFSSVHGITPLVEAGLGIGNEEVHRIKPEQTFGKPLFEDPNVQKQILSLLREGTIVAHNASFERDWLVVNLDGFAELLDNDEIQILDTMQVCSQLMVDCDNSRLETFAEYNGVAYEGAHNAITDTVMMMKALRNFQENLFKNGKFIKASITDVERQQAMDFGKEMDNSR